MLEIRNVSKMLGSKSVLTKVQLTVAPGEFLSILGPSGCGKTTLLRLIAGLEVPDEGSIWIDGKDVTAQPAHLRPVHTVFQRFALFPHMNVFENVGYALRLRKVPTDEIRRRVMELLELVGLADRAQGSVQSLSGGEQQRVALARAVISGPRLLLLDEPLSALDAKLKTHLQEELVQIQKKLKMTFVFVTHDQDEAMAMSDRILVLESGHVKQVGTPLQLYSSPSTPWVANFVGRMNWIPGQSHLGFRPEKTQISPYTQTTHGLEFTARVKSRSFHGTHTQIFVELEEGPNWQIFKPNASNESQEFSPGDKVLVGGNPEGLIRCGPS